MPDVRFDAVDSIVNITRCALALHTHTHVNALLFVGTHAHSVCSVAGHRQHTKKNGQQFFIVDNTLLAAASSDLPTELANHPLCYIFFVCCARTFERSKRIAKTTRLNIRNFAADLL